MSLLHESILDKKFDTRMIERNLNRGQATDKELKAHIEAMPDDSENSIFISLEELEAQKK